MSNEQSQSRSLSACPFCWSNRVVIKRMGLGISSEQHFAQCETCGGDGPLAAGEEAAIAAWNRRGGFTDSQKSTTGVSISEQKQTDLSAERFATPSETAASVGWIPISERTPPSDYVLAADSYYGHARMGQYSEHMKAWLFLTPNGRSEAVGAGRVTHWMPLPEAPK